ncbi:putative protein serine/threonine kinase [Tieghemostelium lacteum]|uniref:Serine/threonine-protein kinase RIO2 n=1 Tax=Tieghemostelium lacteum TaxID=361077 RepID=A0A152A6W5_TIELA|nr:putative protein serine/threonine kinase [Tieghemostelium lacteum]|eukprot:KYR01968.1 putative protein serine/threonine kinase [Tieghemostelium lacteum]
MKLDPKALRFLSREDFRTLVSIEMAMKNHEFAPVPLIQSIANLKFGGCKKSIQTLHKFKLLFHDGRKYDGYKLTYLGYDFLALKAFVSRGTISFVGNQIGVGKESDIYIVANDDNEEFVLKLHRLGRTSFKTIKNNRDYLKHRKSASWLYLSRLAALKEYAYMKALHDNGFPVPNPVDYNRHCIVMSRVRGYPLTQVTELRHPSRVYSDLMRLIVRLASYGLIHGDFNEFNILIDDEEHITLIDFPQMVSTSHMNAEMYFDRDVQCIRTYFEKRFDFIGESWPKFSDIRNDHNLDVQIAASGFTRDNEKELNTLVEEQEGNEKDLESVTQDDLDSDSDSDSEDSEEEDDDDDDDDEVEEVVEEIKGLHVNRNRDFKFIKDNGEDEQEPVPILLRKEYLKEIQQFEGTSEEQPEDDEEEEYQPTKEEIQAEKQKQMVQDRVKKQLTKSMKSKSGGGVRNTVKSRAKKDIKNHINSH